MAGCVQWEMNGEVKAAKAEESVESATQKR